MLISFGLDANCDCDTISKWFGKKKNEAQNLTESLGLCYVYLTFVHVRAAEIYSV